VEGRSVSPVTTIVLIGTLDTKGVEYAYLRDRLRELGAEVLVVDTGVWEPVGVKPDLGRDEVATAGGASVTALAAAGDRGAAIAAMAAGAEAVVGRLYAQGRLDGLLALGGSGGSSIAGRAMQALPVGVPKLLVSTVASGDTRPYVGGVDVTLMHSVVDIAGVNRISARIMANAAGAILGMARATVPAVEARRLVAASMFGVTTPCVTHARARLEQLGYEVLVFHATGVGGRSLEALVRTGTIAGVLDVTITELADELVGGVLSAGPERLEAAGAMGLPQVVSLGALDMVNFGSRRTVPVNFERRTLYVHNPSVTLMRTTPEECGQLGRLIGRKLSAATGPTALFVPLCGVSMIAIEGQPFYDRAADDALLAGLRETLSDQVEVHELETEINDPVFATAMADRLHELIESCSR
jgi:uncharacterized protein (UPF0261 family)